MSMETDIIKLCRKWAKTYNWNALEASANLIDLFGALEWSILDDEPTDEKGNVDWNKLEKMEMKEARRRLFGK